MNISIPGKMHCGKVVVLSAVYAVVMIDVSTASTDYYQILGVSKDATKRQIKSAFRKLAVKYHPDKNKNKKEAEKKFVKIAKGNF